MTPVGIIAASLRDLENELLDAVVTTAALVARADGWVDPVEREQLLDFLDVNEFMSVFTRAEILDAFERRIRELREPDGAVAALGRLRRQSGGSLARSLASLVVDVGEQVAAADCRLDPREQRILQLIRITLACTPCRLLQRTNCRWAECNEKRHLRGSCTVLGAPGGETPPGESTKENELAASKCGPLIADSVLEEFSDRPIADLARGCENSAPSRLDHVAPFLSRGSTAGSSFGIPRRRRWRSVPFAPSRQHEPWTGTCPPRP
jgi:tellurite resistance protein